MPEGPDRRPGDRVRDVAKAIGISLKLRNVMMEGKHDESYCALADKLYQRDVGLCLLDGDLSICAAGEYENGGVWHLENNARTLATVMSTDRVDERRREFRLIAVFDDDPQGRKQFASLTDRRFSPWRPYRHAFLLKRFIPRSEEFREDPEYAVHQANQMCRSMDCEIEDLLSRRLIEEFRRVSPGAVAGSPILHVNEAIHHYEWTRHGKDQLVQYAEEHAKLQDVALIVELIKSLRWVLDLPENGSPA